ncbi:PAP2 superfamily-domain-containing protein [Lineolata rhizophorae]|uniref:PAP2 superfamily-domain-containing protein n=1 Tax=Lineolata rhizophorae TaxID=578093 RepID=A0A6A6NTR9_9PEZI|nr:PAP2 superfamily-domain-containing protein [Lineolata rhizophorae]
MATAPNITVSVEEPEWNSKPAWKLPGWAEPIIVASILFGAMWMTRRRGYRILDRRRGRRSPYKSYLDGTAGGDSGRSSDELLSRSSSGWDSDDEDDWMRNSSLASASTNKHPPKVRDCCGLVRVQTPNSSRFRHHVHSRILQRFPFLIEMFYWIINYAFYRMTSITSQRLFAESGIWNVAQAHGIAVLETEQLSALSLLFPVRERDIQQWFMHGHQDALTVLNKAYALIHIPGTVGFIAWYYYVAPSHATFAVVRRTMTLTNFCAFLTFILYPCMPPRLLPPEYGFLDTVRHDDAQSVWMSGKYVNSLAAMPSMHFGYALCIGCTLVYHSAVFPRRPLEPREPRKSPFWKLWYLALGLAYPAFLLVTIVATANHYFMDAAVAACFVVLSFAANRVFVVFLPLEDWFLWAIRAEKPVPSTGKRFRERGGRRI